MYSRLRILALEGLLFVTVHCIGIALLVFLVCQMGDATFSCTCVFFIIVELRVGRHEVPSSSSPHRCPVKSLIAQRRKPVQTALPFVSYWLFELLATESPGRHIAGELLRRCLYGSQYY
jgi:hypothetical protein